MAGAMARRQQPNLKKRNRNQSWKRPKRKKPQAYNRQKRKRLPPKPTAHASKPHLSPRKSRWASASTFARSRAPARAEGSSRKTYARLRNRGRRESKERKKNRKFKRLPRAIKKFLSTSSAKSPLSAPPNPSARLRTFTSRWKSTSSA